MDAKNIRSIVVATDLTQHDDRVVRVAASIAALTGADLHVLHVLVVPAGPYAPWVSGATPEPASVQEGVRALEAQFRRATPQGCEAADLAVVSGVSASDTIRTHAEELAADLIVLGPHRDTSTDRPFLGATADRLIRTAGRPCLIVRGPMDFPIRRIGVLTDFSPAAQVAHETAIDWMEAFSGGGSPTSDQGTRGEISVGHVAWGAEGADKETIEATRIRPEIQEFIDRSVERADGSGQIQSTPDVLWAGDAVDAITSWVRSRDLAMVVLGTQGISRLPYLYLGSLASTVARSAPCSVMLVPPRHAPAREGEPRLQGVVTGVDFHESSWEAALWAMRHLAPDAQHDLLHVVELPDPPGPLRSLRGDREELMVAARSAASRRLEELSDLGVCPSVETHIREGKPAAEIVRLAEESAADLIIVGEQGPTRGIGALLGSTAERVLYQSRVPVLVARKLSDAPPRRLLVAIDPSEVSAQLLAWAGALVDEFDARATVLNVVDRLLLADELTGLPTARSLQRVEEEAVVTMREWLVEMVSAAELPQASVETRVVVGDPSYEIISEAARYNAADLVLVGSKGGDIARTPLIGRIVNKVVRSAPCSVLVIPRHGGALVV